MSSKRRSVSSLAIFLWMENTLLTGLLGSNTKEHHGAPWSLVQKE